jgi:(2Fe-2S) ferredoxin
MNLSAPASAGQVPVNKALEKTHQVLTYEISRHPKRLIGSAVRNVDEIFDRLQPLFKEVASCSKCQRRLSSSESASPLLYFVSVDIERCFDTIRALKLYRLLKKAVSEEEYLVRKFWVGRQLRSRSEPKDQRGKSSAPSLFFKMERPAFSSGDLQGFDQLASQSKKRNAIFVDGVIYDYVDRASVLKILKEHLLANTVQVNDETFVQCQGIPQGSVLSTTLCNIYYGHFEHRVLRKTLPELPVLPYGAESCQHEALLRYTDDWLFVSADLNRAQRFCRVMHRGNDDYGCHVNTSKSQVNFECYAGQPEAHAVPRFDETGSSGLLSWCGILIDPVRLQIYVNYEK